MNYLSNLAKRVKKTFYEPPFYDSIKTDPVSKGVAFLFAVNVVALGLFGIFLLVTSIPTLAGLSSNTYIDDHYPENLEVVIKDGKASANVEMPYEIQLGGKESASKEGFDSFGVINTVDNLSLEEITAYNSMAVLTKDSLVVFKKGGEIRVIPLKEVKELTVNKDVVKEWASVAVFWLYILIIPLAIMIVFFAAAFSLAYYLVVLLLLAVIPLIVSKVRKNKLTYGQAYSVAIHAIVPVVLADLVAMLFGVMSLPFFAVVALFAIVVVANIWNLPKAIAE